MLKSTSILFFLLVSFCVKSQHTITGRIVDSTSAPMEFVRVVAMKESRVFGGSFTDQGGTFRLDVPDGVYQLLATSAFGDTIYRSDSLTVFGTMDLSLIKIHQSAGALDEVVIEMRHNLFVRKPDRLIFNVEYSIAAAGGDAVDALSVTPGVRVRGTDISLTGKSNVLIMVDDQLIKLGGEDLINFLKSIPSSEIQGIEVISNPPSRYDAEGNSGLINIRLKKSRQLGWNGNVRGSFAQASHPGFSVGGNVNYYTKKLAFFVNANTGSGSIAPTYEKQIFYPNLFWDEQNTSRSYHQFLNGRIGCEFRPASGTVLGLNYQSAYSLPELNEAIKTSQFVSKEGPLDSLFTTDVRTRTSTLDHAIAFFVSHDLDTNGRKVLLTTDYFSYNNVSDRFFDSESYSSDGFLQRLWSTKNTVGQLIQVATAKVDFELPLASSMVNAGVKSTVIYNNSDVAFYNWLNSTYVLDTLQSSTFKYAEYTQAIYGSISREWQKWQFQGGLRAEYTTTSGNSVTLGQVTKNAYVQLFPTFYLVYAPNDSNMFAINYGRRIDRPPYWRLNPFRQYTNAYAYSEGNPLLRPGYYNNLEFSYTYRENLVTSLYVYNGSNRYDQITYVYPQTNIQRTFQKNFLTSYSFGVGESYNYEPSVWWQSSNELVLYMNRFRSSDTSTARIQSSYSAYIATDNSFIINKSKTLMFEANFYYQFPEIDGVDNVGSYASLDLGFRLRLLDKKLSVTLRGVDLLRTDIIRLKSRINAIDQRSERYWDARQILFSVSYSFGRSKNALTNLQKGNDEERTRIQ